MEIIMLLAFLLTACGKKDTKISVDIPKVPTIEYFIYDVNSKKTFEDLEREIGPAKMVGSGISRFYYEVEDLVFMQEYGTAILGESNIILLNVMDMNENLKCTIVYQNKEIWIVPDSYDKIFDEDSVDISGKKNNVDIRSLFDLKKEYTYKDIVNLYGEPQGITDDNRAYYYTNKGVIFFPTNFTSDETVELNSIEIYSSNGQPKCLIYYSI
jgi:hypothetical protein